MKTKEKVCCVKVVYTEGVGVRKGKEEGHDDA
jgi:hypothetical protein